jgi:hypothetical protein
MVFHKSAVYDLPMHRRESESRRLLMPMSVTVDVTTGPRIREYLRQQAPPTAAEIARAGGFTRQYAWRVLDGRERPSERFLEACEKLGIPVLTLLNGGGPRQIRGGSG